jgi:hypothetical protein
MSKTHHLLSSYAVLVAICAAPLAAQQAADRNLECVVDLAVPNYGLSSRRSASGGAVTAIVTVGTQGTVLQVNIQTTDRNLGDEVRTYLGKATKYSPTCEGRNVEVHFIFQLEGEAEWDPPVFVHFRPPNTFVIISRPRKPML